MTSPSQATVSLVWSVGIGIATVCGWAIWGTVLRSKSIGRVRAVAIGLAIALVGAACGSEGDPVATDDSTTTTTTTTITADDVSETTTQPSAESAPLTASWKGVTEDTVSIGVSILDFDALIDMGLQEWGWGDQRLIWEFYLEELNARGGVAGRQVDAKLDFYNPAFALEAEAACLRMTEDREVFAVIGAFLGPAQSATPCLTDQEDLVVFGGSMTLELLEGSKAVWVIGGSSDRRRIPVLFELLEQTGRFDGRAIAVVSGEEDRFTTDSLILPLLEEKNANVVMTAVNTVSTDDVLAEDRFWDTTAERIRTEGADVIIINGDTTGAIRAVGRLDLDQELWVVTGAQLTNLGSTADRSDADGAMVVGEATAEERWTEEAMAACVALFVDAHPEIDVLGPLEVGELDEKWNTALELACRWLALFELIMNEAGPDLTPDAVKAAYERLGDVALPGYVYASFAPGKPDANDGFRLSVWDSTQGDAGGLVPLTDLLDATP